MHHGVVEVRDEHVPAVLGDRHDEHEASGSPRVPAHHDEERGDARGQKDGAKKPTGHPRLKETQPGGRQEPDREPVVDQPVRVAEVARMPEGFQKVEEEDAAEQDSGDVQRQRVNGGGEVGQVAAASVSVPGPGPRHRSERTGMPGRRPHAAAGRHEPARAMPIRPSCPWPVRYPPPGRGRSQYDRPALLAGAHRYIEQTITLWLPARLPTTGHAGTPTTWEATHRSPAAGTRAQPTATWGRGCPVGEHRIPAP